MAKVIIDRFDGGMANDRFEYSVGQSSVVKGFDILTFPHRLLPTRTTSADAAISTGIGNLLVGSDGVIYGLGVNQAAATSTQLYKKADNASNWSALSSESTGSAHINYDLFVEYPDSGSARTIFVAKDLTSIAILDKSNGISLAEHTPAGTITSFSQGFVHPKDDILYIPYTTTTGTFIASFNGATTTWNDTALTLPAALVVTSLSFYGNYLAIACAPKGAFLLSNTGKVLGASANAGSFHSILFLWDRDTSLATISETVDWGTGILQVINNLNGRLIGISNAGGGTAGTSNIIDRNSIIFKEYAGTIPQTFHELSTERQTTTAPGVNINPFVNFIYRNRLYFSIDIVGGSTSPVLYGLWSLGKSISSNQYAIAIERGATIDNTETSVLAAAATGDYFAMVYTAPGTMGFSINTSSLTTGYTATSYYESCVNPGMTQTRNTRMDFSLIKSLETISLSFYPLIANQTITLKYRVDSNNGSSGTKGDGWTTIAVYTSASESGGSPDDNQGFERVVDANGDQFTSGRFYEFRIESTGGAQPIELAYKFEILATNMVD